MKKTITPLLILIILSSCVSKKKYMSLEDQKGKITKQLQQTTVEKEALEAKFAKIEARVIDYNSKINSLSDEVGVLTEENETKFDALGNAVISEKSKIGMRNTLSRISPEVMQHYTTLEDSMNLALSLNLKQSVETSNLDQIDDIDISVDKTVVMISISDKMLFGSGSFKVNNKADEILKKIANVINSEPSIDVMVEGHTDSIAISKSKAIVNDNWDLSVLRATAIIKKLQHDFNVAPEKLIAAGRSSYQPLTDNTTKEGRSRNRRTRIVILPNIDKFFALMGTN